MKVLKSLVPLVAIASLVFFSNCGSDSTETPIQDQQLAKLTATWNIASASRDGVAVDYTGFKLTISGTAGATSFDYSTQGRPALSPWKSSGKWSFGQSVETQIIRDPGTADELQMTYVVTDNSLQLTFTYNGNGFSRVGVVKGQWVFTFTK
jgi:hypothetical protein